MQNEILKVYSGSIAEELGVQVGDRIISINGEEIKDIIDYRFLMADDYVTIEVEKKDNNEIWELQVEKEFNEKFGIEFKNGIIDKAQSCRNKCIFCFIDQLPKGMRKSLYFKDDDSRLSFLQGNFVTLTNMKDEDIDRIINYKISPINISVHTTNAHLRIKMLNNRFAGNVMERLERLSQGGITMNCQLVLCPGVNNGKELTKTIMDLYKFYPNIKNVAGVPVGVTKYREGLFDLRTYDKSMAEEEINLASQLQENFIKEIGVPFIRLSDEFYVLADMDIPEKEFYENFDQLEDGIGMIRIFRENIKSTLNNLKKGIKGEFTLVTGVSAFKEIKSAGDVISSVNKNLNINTVKILNDYLGHTITVAGLITGRDIIKQLKKVKYGEYIIVPKNMLKVDTKMFLDDILIEDIEKALNTKVLVCEYTGEDLIEIINEHAGRNNTCQNQ
ncbi:DUF512 domain-containing protein [Clostridium pasteurianum]|uniref:Fe-S oxidoreductase n=1 Tax=Clostridium pasteurianum BC1 TaxID=86416 RepID=R4K6H0_CLOPA|nr:DUF512 domain-containing protein [Clostridium pasteurianum]AGK97301.1 Fe-S oxidoreductase [Clostridium pasteurianum BC1]